MQLQNVRTSTKLINSLQLHRSQVEGGKEKKKRGKKRKRKLRTFIKQSRAHCTLSAASTDGKFTFSSATTRKQNRSTSMNNARMTTMAIWREQAAEHLIRKLCSWSGNVRRESFFSSLSLSLSRSLSLFSIWSRSIVRVNSSLIVEFLSRYPVTKILVSRKSN